MVSPPLSREDILAEISWHLARHHGWAHWAPTDTVLKNSLPNSEVGRARSEVIPVINSGDVCFIGSHRNRGICLRGEKRTELAYFLRDRSGYDELQITSTISRFPGFNETEEPNITYVNW